MEVPIRTYIMSDDKSIRIIINNKLSTVHEDKLCGIPESIPTLLFGRVDMMLTPCIIWEGLLASIPVNTIFSSSREQ